MPAPGWASVSVSEATESEIKGLLGQIVEVDGVTTQLRTAGEVVDAAVKCLTRHRGRRRQ